MNPSTDSASAVITWAAAAQTLLTLVLIIVTARYVTLTAKLAKSAEEQTRLARTPNLLFDVRPEGLDRDRWYIVNLGVYSVNIQAVYVELLNLRDGSAVGKGLLTTDEKILLHWKRVLGPNQEVRIQPFRPVLASSDVQLSGLIRLIFYFVYGPTGPRTHALDVKVEAAGSIFGRVKLHGQTLRLDEAPPELPATSIDQIQPVSRS